MTIAQKLQHDLAEATTVAEVDAVVQIYERKFRGSGQAGQQILNNAVAARMSELGEVRSSRDNQADRIDRYARRNRIKFNR